MASLTKSQLISALINHGVTPPSPGAKKEKLVQMYEKHVAHFEEAAGEFSSDDEGPAGHMNGEGSVSSQSTDLSELNNEELSAMLRSHGISAGPIVGSTRRLYEKKLARLLGQTDGLSQHSQTVTRRSLRTTTTVVNGRGGGPAPAVEDRYSDSEPEPEPELEPEPEPEPPAPAPAVDLLRQRRTADSAARGYGYSYKASPAAAPTSSSSAQLDGRSPSLRAVFLRDWDDQPTPRRAVRDVRGSYEQEQYLLPSKKTGSDGRAGLDITDSWSVQGPSQKSASVPARGWMRPLVKLCVLLLLIAAAYYTYTHYSEVPSFQQLQQAARDAVRRAADKVDGLRQDAVNQA